MAPTTVPDGDFDADAQMQRELAALVRARESPTTRRPRPRRRALRVESPPRGCRVLPFPTDPPPLSPLSVPQGDDDLLSDEESTLSIASIGSRPFTLDDTRTDDDDDDDRRRGGRPEGDDVFRRARAAWTAREGRLTAAVRVDAHASESNPNLEESNRTPSPGPSHRADADVSSRDDERSSRAAFLREYRASETARASSRAEASRRLRETTEANAAATAVRTAETNVALESARLETLARLDAAAQRNAAAAEAAAAAAAERRWASAFASAAAAESDARDPSSPTRGGGGEGGGARGGGGDEGGGGESIVAPGRRAHRARGSPIPSRPRARDASPPRRPCRRSRGAAPAAAFASRDANETRGSRWRRRRSWARRMTSPPRPRRGRWD